MVGYRPGAPGMIIDTDGGSDDMIAISMALLDPLYSVNTITCVAGNVSLKQCYNNVRALLNEMNIKTTDVDMIAGCNHPLVQTLITADETHGTDGIGDCELSDNEDVLISDSEKINLLYTYQKAVRRKDKFVCIGPLTNIAMACTVMPEVMKEADLWIMGSSGLGEGNVTPYSEYNFYIDPEASSIVINTCDHIHIIGWDVCSTEDNLVEQPDMEDLCSSYLGEWLIRANRTLINLNRSRFHRPCLDLADPVAMACALSSKVGEFHKYSCNVILDEGETRGALMVDQRYLFGYPRKAWICTHVDSDEWKNLLLMSIPYVSKV